MVSIGSKALLLRKAKTSSLTEDSFMAGEHNAHGKRGKKGSMNRKSSSKRHGFYGNRSDENLSGGGSDKTVNKPWNVSKHRDAFAPQSSFLRKQVDPETAKYFSEISNVVEDPEVNLEERSVICGNALEESRGKEVELATDCHLSYTMQTLLKGCGVDHICGFLRSCAQDFPLVAMDRSGSHVAETALNSLAVHLQDDETYSRIEEALTTICQVIVRDPMSMMIDCYGSHVLRSLLCFCKGVPLDSTKSSTVMAERLNFKPSRLDGNGSQHLRPGFPDLLKFLVSGMLNSARKDISTLQANQYGSLVLQTALKLLMGRDEELLLIIPILLGCNMEKNVERNFLEITSVKKLRTLIKEASYSHLMEVILEVAPEPLYNELFTKVFQNSLFQLASHPSGNFVVQALVSHARCQGQMELIWEELGPKFKDLLGMGRSGVIASLIATSLRLHSHEDKCSQGLAAAVSSENESPGCIVPRLLFLESYFSCNDKSSWNWPKGVEKHVMGPLILQLIFKFPSDVIQPFVTSITSMGADQVLEASKDLGGQRVIEAFLSSNASAKQKRRLVMKLRGHFGELALHPSGSFTVDKCFSEGNLSLREAIVSELLAVQMELSKARHGPLLLRKLDVDGYAKRPEQWKMKQSSQQSAYTEFVATFGSKENKPSRTDGFLAETPRTLKPEKIKQMRKEIDASFASAAAPSKTQFLASEGPTTKPGGKKNHAKRAARHGGTFSSHDMEDKFLKSENKRRKRSHGGTEDAAAAATPESKDKKEKKQHRKEDLLKISVKKLKA